MDLMCSAIYQKKDRTDVPGCHNWSGFKKHFHKKLYLFGAAAGSRYFIKKYGRKYFVHGILDNSIDKQGTWFDGNVYVESPQVLKNEDLEQVVVLITGTNHYADVYEQLRGMGVKYCFILCKMEAERLDIRIRVSVAAWSNQFWDRFWKSVFHHEGWNQQTLLYARWMKQCCKYPITENKIVFFSSDECKDHPKYISQALASSDKTLDRVWLLREDQICPEGCRAIDVQNIRQMIYELATAKVWINTDVFPIYVRKRKGQIYIQTKHWSSITLKKFYFDTPIHYKTRPWLKRLWKKDVRMFDYILTGSRFDEQTCKKGFRYHGKFMNAGSPRTDILFQPELCQKRVAEMYGLDGNEKLVLFAPTFRVGEEKGEYVPKMCGMVPDFDRVIRELQRTFGGEWKVLLRMHPQVVTQSAELIKSADVIDASFYPDIQELLASTDVVITDYSSLMFEPAMVGKKIFLFTPDLEEYCKEERELWFDIRELPFSYARNEGELCGNIRNHDEEGYQRKVKNFFEGYGVEEDGHASERAAKFIIKQMGM